MDSPLRVGLLCSVGQTLDAFFPRLIERWEQHYAWQVHCAAGTMPTKFDDAEVVDGLSRRPSLGSRRALAQLREWESRNGLDVVLTNTATASMLVRLARLRSPIVYFCHGLHWNDLNLASLPPRAVEAGLLKNTAAVVCINSDDERWFSRRRAANLLRLSGGVGIELDDFPSLPPAEFAGELRLVWVGELSTRKNPESIIRVVHELRSKGMSVRLDVLGEGILRPRVESLAMQLGVTDLVHLHGRVDPRPFYEAGHVVVHTAHWEGLPRVLIEATVSGRTVVAFDVKGVRDIPGAVLVNEGDEQAFADAVAGFASRHHEADRAGSDALRAAFADTRAADRIADHVGSVVMKSAPGRPRMRALGGVE